MSDFWRDRSVLVTGATGFLGKWLVERFVRLNADVVILVRDEQRNSTVFAPFVDLVRGDVTDQPLLERVIGEYEVRTVFHLAAQTQVGVANRNPVSTWDTNVRGTWAVLEACRRSPLIEQVIIASSDKAYGDQPRLPYTECMPLLAIHPYDASKACADRLAQSYASRWGVPIAITRCGNLFGGGDRHWSRLIPGTIRSVLRGERPVIRGDGKAIRDYLCVEDAVDAYLSLAEGLADKRVLKGQAFNFSLGIQRTALQVVSLVCEVANVDLKPIIEGKPSQGEIGEQSLNCALAADTLGWHPKNGLDGGLRKAIEWYRSNL